MIIILMTMIIHLPPSTAGHHATGQDHDEDYDEYEDHYYYYYFYDYYDDPPVGLPPPTVIKSLIRMFL